MEITGWNRVDSGRLCEGAILTSIGVIRCDKPATFVARDAFDTESRDDEKPRYLCLDCKDAW